MSHAHVNDGETVGEFCARHDLTRGQFFRLNPQFSLHNRIFRVEGVPTAELHVGERLRIKAEASPQEDPQPEEQPAPTKVDRGNFWPVEKEKYDRLAGCVMRGGMLEEHDCATLVQHDGQNFLKYDDGHEEAVPDEYVQEANKFLKPARRCFEAGGAISDVGPPITCNKVGTRTNADGVEEFGVFLDQQIDISEGDEKPKTSPWLIGMGVAGAVGLAALGIYAATRSASASRVANPLSEKDLHDAAYCHLRGFGGHGDDRFFEDDAIIDNGDRVLARAIRYALGVNEDQQPLVDRDLYAVGQNEINLIYDAVYRSRVHTSKAKTWLDEGWYPEEIIARYGFGKGYGIPYAVEAVRVILAMDKDPSIVRKSVDSADIRAFHAKTAHLRKLASGAAGKKSRRGGDKASPAQEALSPSSSWGAPSLGLGMQQGQTPPTRGHFEPPPGVALSDFDAGRIVKTSRD